ncbi:hypothetical protein FVE85_0478 [Porphyridium purpureum]|uniref:BRCT domain-containing protein n=1 Tax=Porphyridium purpureum TaxID=35688 RepID=A0A5J4YYQ8_PORPP|nr:hypothetical protein FVE85_0478 [Porphyridium purpureum]|eukprot:POR7219..scf208_2
MERRVLVEETQLDASGQLHEDDAYMAPERASQLRSTTPVVSAPAATVDEAVLNAPKSVRAKRGRHNDSSGAHSVDDTMPTGTVSPACASTRAPGLKHGQNVQVAERRRATVSEQHDQVADESLLAKLHPEGLASHSRQFPTALHGSSHDAPERGHTQAWLFAGGTRRKNLRMASAENDYFPCLMHWTREYMDEARTVTPAASPSVEHSSSSVPETSPAESLPIEFEATLRTESSVGTGGRLPASKESSPGKMSPGPAPTRNSFELEQAETERPVDEATQHSSVPVAVAKETSQQGCEMKNENSLQMKSGRAARLASLEQVPQAKKRKTSSPSGARKSDFAAGGKTRFRRGMTLFAGFRFALSKFERKESEKVRQKITQRGGQVFDWNPVEWKRFGTALEEASSGQRDGKRAILVLLVPRSIPTRGTTECKWTNNLLCAAAAGCSILTRSWLEACLKQNAIVAPSPYAAIPRTRHRVQSLESGDDIGFSLLACERRAFDGIIWYLDPDEERCAKTEETKERLTLCRLLIRLAGGLLLSTPPFRDFESLRVVTFSDNFSTCTHRDTPGKVVTWTQLKEKLKTHDGRVTEGSSMDRSYML